ncbi:hypothetical protein C8R43DRAFT_956400 [Mycena crocata]|nr:hypothetical protein C8R43DRAFT_956400 [Mycena crocata]
MANKSTLAAARARRAEKAVSHNSRSSSPLTSVTSDRDPLRFPDSDTPIAMGSEPEEKGVVVTRQTRSTKRKSDTIDISDSESPQHPAKKKSRSKRDDLEEDEDFPERIMLSDADSDDSDSPPPRKKPGRKPQPKAKELEKKNKTKAKSKTAEEPETIEIVFMIPEAASTSNRRVPVQADTNFPDAIEIMHETIGCVSVARKPTLEYKFSTSNGKAPQISLRTVDDWKGLVTDATKKLKSKTDMWVTISVLPDNNYSKNKKQSTAAAKANGRSKKNAPMAVMDLDNDDTDGDGDADADDTVEEGEKQAMKELEAEYGKCVKCGPAHVCKIDRGGNHIHLSFSQRRAWAVSLACGTMKVTVKTPPQGALFSMFHGNSNNDGGPSIAAASVQPQYPWYHPPPPPMPFGGYPPVAHPTSTRPSMMSSDPVDDDGTSYPSIIDFIEGLIAKSPQRQSLREVGETLDALQFFDINEIVGLTVEDLGTEKYGNVVAGNAQFLLTRVVKEVKRLDKLAKRALYSFVSQSRTVQF